LYSEMPPRRVREREDTIPMSGEQVMHDMVATMRRIARETQEETRARPGAAPSRMMLTLGQVRKHNPPSYTGGSDPMVAENWLDEMAELLTVLEVDESLKVKVATHYLKGEAKRWWKSIANRYDIEVMDWNTFETLFFEKYFPVTMKDSMRREFLNLSQGTMTVMEYETRFTSLARFAKEMIPTEELKVKQFIGGLRLNLRDKVGILGWTSYATVVERTLIAEQLGNDSQRVQDKERRDSSKSQPKKKQKSCPPRHV